MWSHPNPQDFDLNQLQFSLSEVAFNKDTASQGKWFLEPNPTHWDLI